MTTGREAGTIPGLRGLFGLGVCLAIAWPSLAGAQIVNTLRGFDDQEPGWSGGLEGTVAAADGNTDYFEFEIAAAVQRLTERHRWRGLGRVMERSASRVNIARNQLLHVRHNYRLLPAIASVVFVQWAHDPFRRLETRRLIGAGGRFDPIRTENWNGGIGLAYMFEDEEIGPLPDDAPAGTPDDSGLDANHRLSLFVSLYSASSETVEIDLVGFWQPDVTRLSDARTFVTGNVRVNVQAGLYFLFRYDLVRDSDPPFGVQPNDQTLRSGLGVEF